MSKAAKFGTFGGVFTPSILTILGVIMYLRLPMLVGHVGLLGTLGIIIVAHIISISTGLSISSIATDKKVEAGGTYYMISRSLGLPIGGTLGLALFVGLSLSVSLYLIGFSESFLSYINIEASKDHIRITGTIVLILVAIITLISTSLAIKTQYLIMAAIVFSLGSIVLGAGHAHTPEQPLWSVPMSIKDYVIWFGIFFPAVTGFEAGVSMSGDLKNPKLSIPRGTIAAIVVGLVVYIALTFFLSYTVTPLALQDKDVLMHISLVPKLVIAGIWGATLSSALGSILSAPRILQATAVDNITSKVFAKGTGKANEPRNALLLTVLIAEAGILIGELNVIAEIVSIFFITTYGFLNLGCAFEAWTSADFRPSFKTPVWISSLGAIACFVIMIQLNIAATLGAVIILGLLYVFLKRQELSLQTGDAWSGVWASLVKTGLQRLNTNNIQTRNWRPNIIMFNGADNARPYMTQLGLAIAGKLGILSSFELEKTDNDLVIKPAPMEKVENSSSFFQRKSFCKDIYEGIDEVARVYGFTGVEPNTILMGWSKKAENKERFMKLMAGFQREDFNSLFLSYNSQRKFGSSKTIDVWWSGWGKNLSLAVNLLRYISSSDNWSNSAIRLLVITEDITQMERVYAELTRIVDHFRMSLEIKLVNNSVEQLSRAEIIYKESAQTDLTIIGIPDSQYENLESTYASAQELSNRLGTILFINASSIFEEYDLGIHEGEVVDLTGYDEEISLPIIQPSRYPAIADDIVKIDNHGREVLERFYQKAFTSYFTAQDRFLNELLDAAESTFTSLHRVGDKNAYKQKESLYRVKRHFYHDVLQIIEAYQIKGIPYQMEELQKGIEWYTQQLDHDITRFPKQLTLQYDRSDFKIERTDSPKLKWFKFKKKMLSPFSGKYINNTIQYRELARYYLRDSRHHFLKTFLDEFKERIAANMENIGSLLDKVDQEFEKMEKTSPSMAEAGARFTEWILSELKSMIAENDKLSKLYWGRIMVEFKRNIQLLSLDLERININILLREKKRGKKYFDLLSAENLEYGEILNDHLKQYTNKASVEVRMKALRWWISKELDEFNYGLEQLVDTKIIGPLEKVKLILEESPQQSEKLTRMNKIDWSIKSGLLMTDFEKLEENLSQHVRTLPEEVNIPDSDGSSSGVSVPLSKISHHFLETKLLGPFYDAIQISMEKLKEIVFNINDQLSLAIFNVDNLGEQDLEKGVQIERIVKRTTQEITKQEKLLSEWKIAQEKLSSELLQNFLTPLSVYKLPKTTEEFSHLVRDYRSKQVRSGIKHVWRNTLSFFKRKFLVLLYTRSEGILLAHRLAESFDLKSINEQTLRLLEEVSPETFVLNQLPHYYQNLYSGRSSIGENFWISREIEERQMTVALENYKDGYFGAIMILGDRNAGKTALSRHFADEHLKSYKAHHIFASQTGSIRLEDFELELARITGINNDLRGILNALPSQTAIIIHDLELWWDRSEEGLETVKRIKKLINDYSHRILFILNMNPYAYELIDQLIDFQESFISVIRCQPFSSIELRNLIITRHRSSGLQFSLNKKKEGGLSDIRTARLFNAYFNYSEGNPGVAMGAWLNSITKVSGKNLTMKSPETPNTSILWHLPVEWNVILIQLILHKRMSTEKLERVLGMDLLSIKELLLVLLRAGLIKERTTGLYIVNPYVEPFIVKAFQKMNWL